MDGVLWREDTPIGDLQYLFKLFAEKNLDVVLATNNATRTPQQYQHKLTSFGVKVAERQIITSAIAVADMVARQFPNGGEVYMIGEDGLRGALEQLGFFHGNEHPQAVIAGMDRQFTYDKLRDACRHIRRGAIFYGTNPDRSFPTPRGLEPGAGSILAAIQASTDTDPIIAGKPYPHLYELALERMGLKPQQVIVVGDRLDTDILGAQKMCCRTCLVLSGVTTKQEAIEWTPPPNFIHENLTDFILAYG